LKMQQKPAEVCTKRTAQRLFLVKAPVYLARAWHEAAAGAELGRLCLTPAAVPVLCGTDAAAGQDKKRKREHDPVPHGVVGRLTAQSGLRDHLISLTKLPEPAFCFSDEKGIVMEGTAQVRLDAQPVFNSEYRNFVKGREQKENFKSREVKVIQENETDVKRPARLVSITAPVKRADAVQDKMTRMPQKELIELLFSCFRRQVRSVILLFVPLTSLSNHKKEYWSIKALRECTRQPTVYLRQVLDEVCIYSKKGEHKNMFELRPEYKEKKTKSEDETKPSPNAP